MFNKAMVFNVSHPEKFKKDLETDVPLKQDT